MTDDKDATIARLTTDLATEKRRGEIERMVNLVQQRDIKVRMIAVLMTEIAGIEGAIRRLK